MTLAPVIRPVRSVDRAVIRVAVTTRSAVTVIQVAACAVVTVRKAADSQRKPAMITGMMMAMVMMAMVMVVIMIVMSITMSLGVGFGTGHDNQ